MGETTGCNLLNTKRDGRMPSEFTSDYHVHILIREGEMRFSDGVADLMRSTSGRFARRRTSKQPRISRAM